MLHTSEPNDLLALIAEGLTGSPTEGFFRPLVRTLARALSVSSCLVARFSDSNPAHAEILALWHEQTFIERQNYRVSGSPCAGVLGGEILCFPENLVKSFPSAGWVREIRAQSYLGIPLLDPESRVLGHLAILDTKPMANKLSDLALLSIFATSAARELRQLRAEAGLQLYRAQLHDAFALASDAIVGFDGQRRMTYVNPAATRIFRHAKGENLGCSIERVLPRRLLLHIEQLDQGAEKRYAGVMTRLDANDADSLLAETCRQGVRLELRLSRVDAGIEALNLLVMREFRDAPANEATRGDWEQNAIHP